LRKATADDRDPVLYLPLVDLLNRLFMAIIRTEDRTYIKAFFMTYRRFCTPAEVMREFLSRCREVEGPTIDKDSKMWALQK
jgi:hypothetical protein